MGNITPKGEKIGPWRGQKILAITVVRDPPQRHSTEADAQSVCDTNILMGVGVVRKLAHLQHEQSQE